MSKESRSILWYVEGKGDVENSMGVREQLERQRQITLWGDGECGEDS